MRVEVTPKDTDLLTLVNRCGVVTAEQARMIYGAETKLYLKRLVKLSTNHYITRSSGYIGITEKGSDYLGQEKRVRINDWERPYRAAMAQLVFDLPDWEIEFGTEAKRRIEINRGSKIGAVIRSGNIGYVVYQQMMEDPNQDRIGILWNDLKGLPNIEDCPDRAVIIYKNKSAIEGMFEKVKTAEPKMKEIFLVGSGVSLAPLTRYHSDGFMDMLIQRFPGLAHCNRKLAQYKYKDDYVSVQVYPDAVKMKYLHSYYTGLGIGAEGRTVNIVCTDSGYNCMRNLFPLARYHIISDDLTSIKPVPRIGARPSPQTTKD